MPALYIFVKKNVHTLLLKNGKNRNGSIIAISYQDVNNFSYSHPWVQLCLFVLGMGVYIMITGSS